MKLNASAFFAAAVGSRFSPLVLCGLVAVASIIGNAALAQFTDGGFETGTADAAPPSPWVVTTFTNLSGFTAQSPQTIAGLNLTAGGERLTETEQSTVGPDSEPDPYLGSAAKLRWPRYGSQCAAVNYSGGFDSVNGRNVNELTQTATIGPSSVDPADGQIHIRMVIAPVLQDADHTTEQLPYYFVQVSDLTRDTVLYEDFGVTNDTTIPWQSVYSGDEYGALSYTYWQLIDVAPGSANIAMGDQVQITAFASGCSLGGHGGELYVDGASSGSLLPGIFVSGSSPATTLPLYDLTYTFNYQNGSASAETNVVLSLPTPANTTFVSVFAPGLLTVSPAIGSAGTVTGTFPTPLPAGASGSVEMTVQVAANATGTIVNRSYSIASNQETPLLGSPIRTTVLPPVTSIHLSAPTFPGNGNVTLSFTNTPSYPDGEFSVYGTTNLSLPFNQWSLDGYATETPTGSDTYTFTEPVTGQARYFRVYAP